jgi:tricorn protease
VATKAINQLTNYDDFPVAKCNGNGKIIIFEQGGTLHTFDPSNAQTKDISISIKADLLELRESYVTGSQYIRSAHISPSGKRVVFDFRGEIITLPAEKGDAKNLTQSQGDHEQYPAWSPDGKTIAYFSDASGEYELHLKPTTSKGKVKTHVITGNGFYTDIQWSPDSKQICFVDNSRTLYLFNIQTGMTRTIDADELYVPGPFRNLFGDWSADSKWILYTKILESNYEKVFLYSVDQNKSYPITDGLSSASSPTFDKDGKYLYFFASTDAGPIVNWFAQSNNDMVASNAIYLATLQKETINPFFKENDEEVGDEENEMKDGKKDEKKSDVSKDWKIDLDGLENRIVDIPVEAGMYYNLKVNKSGQLLYMASSYNNVRPNHLRKYDFEKREDSKVMEVDNFLLSSNGAKMLFWKNGSYGITDAGEAPKAGKGMLNLSALEVKINPKEEWENIFEEAWRINRDYFYDPGMHGADWAAEKKKYQPFIKHLSCKTDLYRVIQWMCSELGVGHHRYSFPGWDLDRPKRIRGGLLGVDYAVANNRYQFKKIYGGLNWNPNLRSPMTEPGVNVKEGEYLLAVNGQDLTADQNIYSLFENTSGKILELTVGGNPNYTDSRTVKVVPVGNENALRNRDWVEGNLKRVHEATDGQVAYVYVPNTAGAGHEYFKRYFFPQANKKAIIVDERFNGGGQIADYYIDVLLRPYQSYWNFRYGKDLKTPSASIQGPKVMLIDENAGSGGDMLPWMFRKFEVGTLIGKRTWGGLVGVLGFPEFIDGGSVTAPNVAIWTKDGFIVENVGVAPDIDVEQTPSEVIQGKDPQLERAIEEVMKQLKENPQVKPKRPNYPIRGGN